MRTHLVASGGRWSLVGVYHRKYLYWLEEKIAKMSHRQISSFETQPTRQNVEPQTDLSGGAGWGGHEPPRDAKRRRMTPPPAAATPPSAPRTVRIDLDRTDVHAASTPPSMSQETTTPQKNTAARLVAGTSMHEGETVWVEAPVDHAPHGTCGAVKRLKTPGISAASRCSPKTKTAMPTGYRASSFMARAITTAPTRPTKLSLRSKAKPRRGY